MMDRIYVMELVRSHQVGQLSRRDFLSRATLALGSAVAAYTLLAACVPVSTPPPPVVLAPATDTPEAPAPSGNGNGTGSLQSVAVTYPDRDGETLMGYLSQAPTKNMKPGVIVIQEWWGLNEHIKDVTRRFAAAGYVALAPDLYHGAVVSEPDEARKLVMQLDMAEAVQEIRQAVSFLRSQPGVLGPKVGIVGFCMGGRLVLETAHADDTIGAAVAFYGSPLAPEQAKEIKAPLLGLYGAADQGIPEAGVRAMERALIETGIPNDFHIYAGAPHAFFNDTGSGYNKDAATDAWTRTLAWFRQYLAA